MTHELKELVKQALHFKNNGLKTVLASVVSLEGSSYRRPGVRMLIAENGQMVGAVSGGCVEKDISLQAQSVFENGLPKMMQYDGRLRLGCEGVIHILIELVDLSKEAIDAFDLAITNRIPIDLISYYTEEYGEVKGLGTQFTIKANTYRINQSAKLNTSLSEFKQQLKPLFQLLIIGAEHDAVQLSKTASNLGWDVTVMAAADEQKSLEYFSGASQLITPLYDEIDKSLVDKQTAVVLMTHSYQKDVQYLLALEGVQAAYFGLLGPKHRRERLLSQLLDLKPDIDIDYIDQFRGPTGIDIGAESAAEIAVSIVAEILSVIRAKEPKALKDKSGNIHA